MALAISPTSATTLEVKVVIASRQRLQLAPRTKCADHEVQPTRCSLCTRPFSSQPRAGLLCEHCSEIAASETHQQPTLRPPSLPPSLPQQQLELPLRLPLRLPPPPPGLPLRLPMGIPTPRCLNLRLPLPLATAPTKLLLPDPVALDHTELDYTAQDTGSGCTGRTGAAAAPATAPCWPHWGLGDLKTMAAMAEKAFASTAFSDMDRFVAEIRQEDPSLRSIVAAPAPEPPHDPHCQPIEVTPAEPETSPRPKAQTGPAIDSSSMGAEARAAAEAEARAATEAEARAAMEAEVRAAAEAYQQKKLRRGAERRAALLLSHPPRQPSKLPRAHPSTDKPSAPPTTFIESHAQPPPLSAPPLLLSPSPRLPPPLCSLPSPEEPDVRTSPNTAPTPVRTSPPTPSPVLLLQRCPLPAPPAPLCEAFRERCFSRVMDELDVAMSHRSAGARGLLAPKVTAQLLMHRRAADLLAMMETPSLMHQAIVDVVAELEADLRPSPQPSPPPVPPSPPPVPQPAAPQPTSAAPRPEPVAPQLEPATPQLEPAGPHSPIQSPCQPLAGYPRASAGVLSPCTVLNGPPDASLPEPLAYHLAHDHHIHPSDAKVGVLSSPPTPPPPPTVHISVKAAPPPMPRWTPNVHATPWVPSPSASLYAHQTGPTNYSKLWMATQPAKPCVQH